jgi:hypothetical protein
MDHEEFHLLGCKNVQSVKSKPTFRKNKLPPTLGLKNEPSKKPALLATCSMLYSFLNIEDGRKIFLRNASAFPSHHMALYLSR